MGTHFGIQPHLVLIFPGTDQNLYLLFFPPGLNDTEIQGIVFSVMKTKSTEAFLGKKNDLKYNTEALKNSWCQNDSWNLNNSLGRLKEPKAKKSTLEWNKTFGATRGSEIQSLLFPTRKTGTNFGAF